LDASDGTLLEYPVLSENGFNNIGFENGNAGHANALNPFSEVHNIALQQQIATAQGNNELGMTSINNNPLSKAIMLEGDFEFLRYLGLDELKSRMANLDLEMEEEIEELRRRYAAKRQPILDAMDAKKKRQQNF